MSGRVFVLNAIIFSPVYIVINLVRRETVEQLC